MIRIKKVKDKGSKGLYIEYEVKNKDGKFDEFTMKCSEKAKPSFYVVLSKLGPHVIEMCELPEDMLKRVTVRGASFSYSGPRDTMGAVIVAGLKLVKSGSIMNVITPYKLAIATLGKPSGATMQGKCSEILNRLCAETEDYINGSRAQMELKGTEKKKVKGCSK